MERCTALLAPFYEWKPRYVPRWRSPRALRLRGLLLGRELLPIPIDHFLCDVFDVTQGLRAARSTIGRVAAAAATRAIDVFRARARPCVRSDGVLSDSPPDIVVAQRRLRSDRARNEDESEAAARKTPKHDDASRPVTPVRSNGRRARCGQRRATTAPDDGARRRHHPTPGNSTIFQ